MKIELHTHIGVIIENPIITINSTIDYPLSMKFKPIILIECENIKILHDCEMVDYVNGTWTDSDVLTAVDDYLKKIEV